MTTYDEVAHGLCWSELAKVIMIKAGADLEDRAAARGRPRGGFVLRLSDEDTTLVVDHGGRGVSISMQGPHP